jgi:TRAP-type mannitol/chloroaromatic compound transport system permease small subunit
LSGGGWSGMTKFLFFIDELSTWVGKAFAWLILILTLSVSYEVFVRYVLRAPTTWAFDISYITYGAMFLMAGAYTLSRNGHVRADVVYRLWKRRTQATVDLVFSPAGVPVFPLKALIPITGVLLLLQGFAEIIRCILCIRTGQWPQRLHDVEETESVVIREHQQQAAAARPDGKGAGA